MTNEPTPAAKLGQENGYLQLVDSSKRWYKNRRLIVLNLWIVLLLVTSMANGYDGSMMNGLQLLEQWQIAFNHPTGSMLGLLGAIQQIGSLGTFLIAPYCSDLLGRKKTIFIGTSLIVVGAALQAAAHNVQTFIGARFLVGFGSGIAGNSAPMLVMEIAYPTQRAPIGSVYNALWPGGALFASWVTFGSFHIQNSWSWRIPSALQALPSIFQALFILFGPESPRWLVGQNRKDEALEVLAYYHANGNPDDPLVQFEYEEIVTAIEEEKLQNKTGWLELVKTPGNRKRMRIAIAIAVFSQWSGSGLVSYYLNQVFTTIGITDPIEQLLINAFLNLWSLILAVLGGIYCDRVGRRPLFLISTAGMLLFFLLQTVCSAQYALHGNKAAGNAVVAFIYLYSAAYAIAYSPLITSYTLEILPFALRAKGFTVFGFALSLSLVFNQYVNPIALKALGWKYYIVYVVWLAFELIFIYFFLVETKNRTLEETAAIFDGDTSVFKLTRKAATHAGIEGAALPEVPSSDADRHSSSVEKGSIGEEVGAEVIHRGNAGKRVN